MTKVTSIQCTNHVGMNAHLPLEDGVTTVTGPNAGGKTMLVSVVPGILFNESKLGNGATTGFTWEAPSGPGSMFVSKRGAKTVWRGTVDGEAADHNTIKAAQLWMQEHFPVSQHVFPVANYLAAFRSSTMLAGAPAARMELLSNIVGLRIFDTLRTRVGKLANSANVTVALKTRLLNELREIESESVGLSEPRFYLGGITNELSERRSDIKSEALQLARVLEDRPMGNISTNILTQLLALAPARNRAWDDWEECEALNVHEIKKPSKTDYNHALALREILNEDDRNLEYLTSDEPYVFGHAKEQGKLSKLVAEIDNIDKQLEHLDGHSGSTCPTCNSKINSRLLTKTLTKARKRLDAKTTAQRALTKRAKAYDAIQAIARSHKVTDLKELRVLIAFNWQDFISSYEAAVEIEKRFGGSLPPKPTKARIDVGMIQHELRMRKRYGMLKTGERDYERLTQRFEGASGVLAAVTGLVEQQAEAVSTIRQRKRLVDELASLPNTEESELLIEILKALENKNARNQYLELVAEHLVEKLNELAVDFFDYKMEFAWSAGRLTANRKGAATDTVLLSGREGRTFMLLNAVATQLCLPPARRLRTLFLDEIEAGSSPENRTLLAELIPTLLDHYSNIVVVTPLSKSELYIEGPRYRVTNKKTLVREE